MSNEPPGEQQGGRLKALLSGDLVQAGMQTYVLTGLTLAANLLAGIVTARALAPSGRGEAVAIAALAQNLGFIFSVGCIHALSFRYARQPAVGARLLTTWAVLLLPLTLIAIAVGELALPALFSSQSDEAIALARIYLLTVVLVLWSELTNGLLLGAGDYLFVNVARFAQPALAAAAMFTCWRLDALTVPVALVISAASSFLVQACAMARALRKTGGFGRLDVGLGLQTLWYGVRSHGALVGNALNQRLDLVILPAFVAAAGLGLYSIAANVSLIVSTLASNLGAIVLPEAARDRKRAPETVIAWLQVTLVIAAVLALGLFVLARPALGLVYGSDFEDAAGSLRILLPGTVLLAGASILAAGLYAADRPTIATAAQLSGLLITVVGLTVVVPSAGIKGAAMVSSASYAVVFLAALVAYKRVSAVTWGRFATPPASLQALRRRP